MVRPRADADGFSRIAVLVYVIDYVLEARGPVV